MDSINKERMLKALKDFKVVDKELISTYQEGYIGKNVYSVTLADGSTRRIEEILKRGVPGDAAVIIPITIEGNIVMVVQSRPNTKETVSIELPAGMVDSGEDYQDTAIREMLEETGYEAENVYELEWHYQDQGCSGAIIKTFVAEGCKKKQEVNLDAGERLQYVEMSFEDIINLIKSREINDANTKIAVLEYTIKKKGLL
jgi:ADP-ribose pyrophosphatase